MWNLVGMGRTAEGLIKAIEQIDNLKKEFDTNLFVPGEADTLNVELEKALRLEDFFTIGRLMAIDALQRVVRRTLPRGVSDRGWRGTAPRRPVHVCKLLEVCRRGRKANLAERTAQLRGNQGSNT